ncbi:RluA family pseudouridine synthase [Candidatus Uhrbacteria bacterium]|nr:RluA family pseudouridine synthase [Candidatus Uhrbacteria bacterium]
MKYVIPEEQAGMRLDRVLLILMPEQSRATIQKRIEKGEIRVNEKIVRKHFFVHAGDSIDIGEEKKVEKKQKPSSLAPSILSETDEYVVLNKPSGMVIHPTTRQTDGTVVDFLLKKYPKIKGVGDDPLRPGIVHRLDKDASGIMVVAKTQDAFDVLKRQFFLREVKKQYLILVYGNVTPHEGVIALPISRSTQKRTRFAAGTKGGRAAETQYWVQRHLRAYYTLVRVEPKTGRTHQIRVHFLSKGYPVVGDVLYRSRNIKKPLPIRLMLHAEFLGFKDVSGAWQEYTCPPGEDFSKVVRQVEG